VAAFTTDIRQRLQASWARRGEAMAAFRQLPNTLKARVSSSNSPLVQRAFATRTMDIAAIVVGLMVVVGILALVIGAPVPFVANSIAKRFFAETGYRLQVAGRARVRLWPSPTVTLGNITVLEADSTHPRTVAMADGVRLQLSVWSLVARRPQLAELAISRPKVQVPLLRERPAPASAAPATTRPAAAKVVSIDRFVVEDGAVEFTSQGSLVESRIDGITVSGSLSADRSLATKLSGRWGAQVLRADIKSKLPADSSDKRVVPLEFTIDAPGLLLDALSGRAEAGVNGNVLTLNSLTGAVGKSIFTGQGSIGFAGKPAIKLNLDLQRIDIAVTSTDVSANAASAAALDQPWSDTPIGLDWLNFLDAEMQITAADLRVDRFRFAPASVGVILTNGLLTTGLVRTGIYGGQIQGTLIVDASQAEPSHALRVDLTGVKAFSLLSDVASFDGIDGSLQAKIDARGRGTNLRSIISTLYGAVDLSVQDGELRSVNIAKMIRFVAAGTLNGWQENKAEKTDLTQLSAFFRLEGGKASTDNLRLIGPLVRVTGTGTADLAAKTLQFRVEPKLVLSLEAQGGATDPVGIGVPVAVQGPWGAPRIYPEVAGILENPDAAYAKLRELGQGLFGMNPGQSGIPTSPPKLPQSIDALIDRAGGDRKTIAPPTASAPGSPERERPQQAAPVPVPRPQPQVQARPQPAPAPPAQSSQSQSSSQSPSLLKDGPIEFFKNVFGK
jgi:AsmA protein